MSEPKYSGGGLLPMQPANTVRIVVNGNMYAADRTEGTWYRIITAQEAKSMFERWKANKK